MSREARAWLPDAAVLDGVLERRFEALVENWSQKWCVPGARASCRLAPAPFGLPSPPGPQTWTTPANLARLALSAKSESIVARALLGLKRLPPKSAAGDYALIGALETRAVTDFAEMISPIVPACRSLARGPAAPADRSPLDGMDRGIMLSVDLKSFGTWFDLFIRFDQACGARRASVGAKREARVLGRLSDALSAQTVAVSARAGRGALTLAEYSGLSEGDVLILDRPLASGLEVLVDGRAISDARCDIGEIATGIGLRVTGVGHAG